MCFRKIFGKKNNREEKVVKPIPSLDEVVKIMYNEGLNHFTDEVIIVFYSTDKSRRYILLQREDGFYTYTYEQIYVFDDEEWQYIYEDENTLPGMWAAASGGSNSIFETIEDAINELKNESEFKTYFV